MVLSFLFLVTAVYSLRHWASRRWLFWFVSACVLGVVALSGLEYCVNLITGTGINGAVFYHLRTGLEGGDTSQYLLPGLAATAVLGGVAGLLLRFRKRLEPRASPKNRWIDAGVALLAVSAVLAHPASVATASHSLRFSLVNNLSQPHSDFFIHMIGNVRSGLEAVHRCSAKLTAFLSATIRPTPLLVREVLPVWPGKTTPGLRCSKTMPL